MTVTLKEFLAGETLNYRCPKNRPHAVTYRVGVGIYVDADDRPLRGADDICTTDLGASRVYHSITRRDECE